MTKRKSLMQIIKSHRGEESPQGDLADDMERDKKLPKLITPRTLYEHLCWSRACAEAIEAYFECLDEYYTDAEKRCEAFYLFVRHGEAING